jgi:hypothetical protein
MRRRALFIDLTENRGPVFCRLPNQHGRLSDSTMPAFGPSAGFFKQRHHRFRADPRPDLAFGLTPAEAVALLKTGGQFLLSAVYAGDVLVGEPGPVFGQLTLECDPIALDLTPIHDRLPYSRHEAAARGDKQTRCAR